MLGCKTITYWLGNIIQNFISFPIALLIRKMVCDTFLCTNLSDVFLCTISYFDLIFLALDQFLHHVLQHPSV